MAKKKAVKTYTIFAYPNNFSLVHTSYFGVREKNISNIINKLLSKGFMVIKIYEE